MARDIVQSALLEAKRAREVAMENAKDILIESLTPRLERVLSTKLNRISEEDAELEKLTTDDGDDLVRDDDGGVFAGDVPDDVEGDAEEWADGSNAGESAGSDDLTEDDEYGGDKGDESRSRRDYEENFDLDEDDIAADDAEDVEDVEGDYDYELGENDEYGGDKGDESRSRRDYEEHDELDIDVEEDDDVDIEDTFETSYEEDEEEELGEVFSRARSRKARPRMNVRKLVSEHKALRKANRILTKELRESNLFNVKLSHALRLLESNGGALTGNQRKRIVSSLDRAKTVREAHLIARSIHESLKVAEATPRRKRIHESASRKTRVASLLNEGGAPNRWAALAGITS